jgi:hypothetical protein
MKISDFQNLDYAFYVENTVSKTKISEPDCVKIIEFTDGGLVLQMPKNICALGHLLSINLFPNPTKFTLPEILSQSAASELLNITAKVIDFKKDVDQLCRVVITFLQFDVAAWNGFLQKYADRQAKLDALMRNIKGD